MSPSIPLLSLALCLAGGLAAGAPAEPPAREAFMRFALTKEGDPIRGRDLFQAESRLVCSRCHTLDGSAGRAGPDLSSIGDKLGRREMIEAVLTPSATICVGYSTTSVETKSGEEYSGILKQANATEIALMGMDARVTRIPLAEIATRRTSEISFMPEGLQNSLTLQEFADVIDYLVSLKQPEHAAQTHHGMPDTIPAVANPVGLTPLNGPDLKFQHPAWFGLAPGRTNVFLVVEHESGKVWRFESGEHPSKTVFLETGAHDSGARGLIDLAFHPRFGENRKYYVAKQIGEHGQFASVVYERQAGPDGLTDSGREGRLILKVPAPVNSNHAGSLEFGPDGYFYIGMGDGGPGEDPEGHGQNTSTLLGKILRIDVDHAPPGAGYASPPDNPFQGRDGFRPEIWAYGLREPWRFSFDRVGGDLWVADVGQDRYEEIDVVRAGENYGWNIYEGFEPFSNRYRREGEQYVPPVFSYRRKYGVCTIGGYVYREDPHSSFYGVYIFGDHESRRIFGLTQENRVLKVVRQIGQSPERIASFTQGPAGELFILGYEGTIFKLDFSGRKFE